MIIKEVQVTIPPPKLSFHWAQPWVNKEYAHKQFAKWVINNYPDYMMRARSTKLETLLSYFKGANPEKYDECYEEYSKEIIIYDSAGMGTEHNEAGAVFIIYEGEKIRLFPDEIQKDHSMPLYIEEDLLILHPSDAAQTEEEPLNDLQKVLYEHALVDGCNKFQATLTAFGKSYADVQFPPIGWYEMRPEVVAMF